MRSDEKENGKQERKTLFAVLELSPWTTDEVLSLMFAEVKEL